MGDTTNDKFDPCEDCPFMAQVLSKSSENHELLHAIKAQLTDVDKRLGSLQSETHDFHVKIAGNGVDSSGGEVGRLRRDLDAEVKERKHQQQEMRKQVVRTIWMSVGLATLLAKAGPWGFEAFFKLLEHLPK